MNQSENSEICRPKRPHGGRPSLHDAEKLHGRILDAAAELFTKHGYGETSIEAIAAHAGIGKLTLYRRFRDKNALFQAVVTRLREQQVGEMAKIGECAGSLTDVLTAVGQQLLSVVLSPQSLSLHRIVLAESARLPDLCANMYQDSSLDAERPVFVILRRFADAGALRVDDIAFLRQQFIQAIIGGPLQHALLARPPMSAHAQKQHVRDAVDMFLRGAAS